MIELYNDDFDEKVARKYLELRSKLGNNLIKVEGDRISKSITAYVYKKVEIEGIKLLSVEDLIKESLSSVSGISFEIKGKDVVIKVETLRPEIYEEISVTLYEIEKRLGIKLNVSYIT